MSATMMASGEGVEWAFTMLVQKVVGAGVRMGVGGERIIGRGHAAAWRPGGGLGKNVQYATI
jgi:hypothetical protein